MMDGSIDPSMDQSIDQMNEKWEEKEFKDGEPMDRWIDGSFDW